MIYDDKFIYVEFEKSEIPWVKIFVKGDFKDICDLDEDTRNRLFAASLVAERSLKEFYNPDKINWASFGNYVPRVHIHIQARFYNDNFFPESLWGKRRRIGFSMDLKIDEFKVRLSANLSNHFKSQRQL